MDEFIFGVALFVTMIDKKWYIDLGNSQYIMEIEVSFQAMKIYHQILRFI
jgi:hypothetical protein